MEDDLLNGFVFVENEEQKRFCCDPPEPDVSRPSGREIEQTSPSDDLSQLNRIWSGLIREAFFSPQFFERLFFIFIHVLCLVCFLVYQFTLGTHDTVRKAVADKISFGHSYRKAHNDQQSFASADMTAQNWIDNFCTLNVVSCLVSFALRILKAIVVQRPEEGPNKQGKNHPNIDKGRQKDKQRVFVAATLILPLLFPRLFPLWLPLLLGTPVRGRMPPRKRESLLLLP